MHQFMMRTNLFALLVSLCAVQPIKPDEPKPVSFMGDIAPILQENCFACHDAKKRKGKFDMTTYERLMQGGEKGGDVVPGKPEESLLWTLTTDIEPPRMPPKANGDLLSEDKVALFERWIKEGAKFDGPSPQTDLIAELRRRWQPPTPPEVYPYPAIIRAMTFTPDGKKLITGGQHELLFWDVESGKLESRIHTRAERANGVLVLPDGKTLAVAGGRPGQEGDVCLYRLDVEPGKHNGLDPAHGVLVRELERSDDEILCLALSADGKKLASGGCDRIIRVWNLEADFKLEQSIENHADWVFGLAFAPDNNHLLTCSRDKTAKVWDLAAKESVLTFPGHQQPVFGVAVQSDGKQGISAGEDNLLRVWNASGDGKEVRSLKGHGKTIWNILRHPEKPLVASASADGTVRLWNPDDGKAVRTLSGHTDWVYALAFSSDGTLLASGSWNGEIRIWKVEDGELVKAFNGSPGR